MLIKTNKNIENIKNMKDFKDFAKKENIEEFLGLSKIYEDNIIGNIFIAKNGYIILPKESSIFHHNIQHKIETLLPINQQRYTSFICKEDDYIEITTQYNEMKLHELLDLFKCDIKRDNGQSVHIPSPIEMEEGFEDNYPLTCECNGYQEGYYQNENFCNKKSNGIRLDWNYSNNTIQIQIDKNLLQRVLEIIAFFS